MTITDSRIRAAVWQGTVTGRWYVDVYYARHRTTGTPVFERADVDGDPTAETIQADYATRCEALDRAAGIVGTLRSAVTATIAARAGVVTADEALAGLATLCHDVHTPDPMEAP